MDGKKLILAASVVLLVLATGVALAADSYAIPHHVIGGGGGRVTSGVYTLAGVIGQPVAGLAANAPYDLCAGFWCGAGREEYKVYLPLVIRNN